MRTALSGTTLCSSLCAATMASVAAARPRPATSATAPCGWPLTTPVHHPVPVFLLPHRMLHRDTCALWQQIDIHCRTALLNLMSLGFCAMCSARRGPRRAGVAAGGAQRERARQRRRRVRARAGALDHAVPAARGALAHGRAPTSLDLSSLHTLWRTVECGCVLGIRVQILSPGLLHPRLQSLAFATVALLWLLPGRQALAAQAPGAWQPAACSPCAGFPL